MGKLLASCSDLTVGLILQHQVDDSRAAGELNQWVNNHQITWIARTSDVDSRPNVQRIPTVWRARLGLGLLAYEQNFIAEIQRVSREFDVLIWFSTPFNPISSYIAQYARCPVIFYPADSIVQLGKSHLEATKGRISLKTHLRMIMDRRLESRVCTQPYVFIVFVSELDADTVRQQVGRLYNHRIYVIPNGVDINEFSPSAKVNGPRDKNLHLLFSGVMSYGPNVEAARVLLTKIAPRLKNACLPFRITLAGRDPAESLSQLAKLVPEAHLTGRVPSLAPFYRDADLFVAPLNRGAGIKNKVLEALASGLPVLGSRVCFGAFNEIPPGGILCESIEEFVESVLSLAYVEEDRHAIGLAGRRYVEANHSWYARLPLLLKLLRDAVEAEK